MSSYFNTTNSTGANLKQFEQKAQSQEEIIKGIFKKNTTTGLTAVEVMYKFPEKRVPLTSIRRAMTNLTEEGFLVKTQLKREGLFGRDNFIYIRNTGQMTLQF